MPLNSNPFDQEENLTSWFDRDNLYQNSKKSSLKNFKQSLNFQNNIFMSFKDSYMNLVNNITKHAFLATLIMLISLGGVGASAAQLLAPEAYKPSTLIQKTFNPKDFEANKQQEKNPYTPLKPDENNDVARLDKCDLSVKYPKRISGQYFVVYNSLESNKASIYSSNPGANISEKTVGYTISTINDNQLAFEDVNSLFNLSMTCSDKPLSAEENNGLVPYTRQDLQNLTGWFVLAEAEIEDIKGDDPNTLGVFTRVYFKYKNTYYVFAFSNQKIPQQSQDNLAKNDPQSLKYFNQLLAKNGLYGNQVQIQFNSLVQNEANTEVIEKPKPQTNNSSSSSSNNISSASTSNSNASLQTYTNKFFPDFKLVYDSSWKFETSTEPAFESLLTRRIKLTKNSKTLEFIINPVLPFGSEPAFVPDAKTCQPGSSQEELIKEGTLKIDKFANGVEKFTIKTKCKNGWETLNNKVYYGELNIDSFVLKSNIKAKDIKGYTFAPEDGFVRYRVSQIGELDTNDPFVKEITKLFLKAVLGNQQQKIKFFPEP